MVCRYITQQELGSLSSYMTARLSLEKVWIFPARMPLLRPKAILLLQSCYLVG